MLSWCSRFGDAGLTRRQPDTEASHHLWICSISTRRESSSQMETQRKERERERDGFGTDS